MGVEVTGDAVTLTASDTIRVVAGIEADQLTMTAETVEFATTEATDNPNGRSRTRTRISPRIT